MSGKVMSAYLSQLCVDRSLNVDLMNGLLTDQCHLRIGNASPSLGKPDVLRELAGFVRQADSIGLGYFDAWRSRNVIILELDCVMTRKRGLRITVPFVAILRMADDLVDDIRIYIDRPDQPPLSDETRLPA